MIPYISDDVSCCHCSPKKFAMLINWLRTHWHEYRTGFRWPVWIIALIISLYASNTVKLKISSWIPKVTLICRLIYGQVKNYQLLNRLHSHHVGVRASHKFACSFFRFFPSLINSMKCKKKTELHYQFNWFQSNDRYTWNVIIWKRYCHTY